MYLLFHYKTKTSKENKTNENVFQDQMSTKRKIRQTENIIKYRLSYKLPFYELKYLNICQTMCTQQTTYDTKKLMPKIKIKEKKL